MTSFEQSLRSEGSHAPRVKLVAAAAQSFEHIQLKYEDITLRDYFAAMALQTLLATQGGSYAERVNVAYHIAELMLTEKAKRDTNGGKAS